MEHVIEQAASGRSKCRGCGESIAKGVLRLGERSPNPFGDGEMTQWFHLACGAYKRPEPFLEAVSTAQAIDDRDCLVAAAEAGVAHRRLPRIAGAERSPSGRARCRSCREPIPKGEWRIPLLYHEEGRFHPSGAIHMRCARAYFETAAVIDRVRHFNPSLGDLEIGEIEAELMRMADPPDS